MCSDPERCPRAYMSIHIQVDLPDPDELCPRWWVKAKLIMGTELVVARAASREFKEDQGPDHVVWWVADLLTDALHGDGLCDPFRPAGLPPEPSTVRRPAQSQLPGQQGLPL